MSINIHDDSTLTIRLTVIDESTGLAKSISGATITANARKKGRNGGEVVNGIINVINASAGIYDISFTLGDIAKGIWRLQSRVVLGVESQVVFAKNIESAEAFV